MKSLKEPINESNLDWFDKQILEHIAIEYFNKDLYCKTYLIAEKYGVYEDLDKIVSIVKQKVFSFLVKNKNNYKNKIVFVFKNSEFNGLKNIFFGQLELSIIIDPKNNGNGAYINQYSNLNKNTSLFDKIHTTIFTDTYLSEFEIALQHELTHAYEDWNRQLKGDNYFAKKTTTDFYSLLQKNISDDNVKIFLKDALYFTLGIERNAFVSELTAFLKKNKNVIKSPTDALRILKQNQNYQTYKALYVIITEYENENIPVDIANYITSEYNRICKTNLTTNKVFKKLKHLIQKSINKFDTIIGKLCYENLNNTSIIVDNQRQYMEWRSKNKYNIYTL